MVEASWRGPRVFLYDGDAGRVKASVLAGSFGAFAQRRLALELGPEEEEDTDECQWSLASTKEVFNTVGHSDYSALHAFVGTQHPQRIIAQD